jgi:hypothetical protein
MGSAGNENNGESGNLFFVFLSGIIMWRKYVARRQCRNGEKMYFARNGARRREEENI